SRTVPRVRHLMVPIVLPRPPACPPLGATAGRRPVPGRPAAGASVPARPPCSLDGLRPAALHSFQIAEEDFRMMENRRKSSRFPPEELTAGRDGRANPTAEAGVLHGSNDRCPRGS